MFSLPRIKAIFARYTLLRLYTDRVPAGTVQVPDEAGATLLRNDTFKNAALPFYVIILPMGDKFETVRYYDEGLINDVDAFARFLEQPLGSNRAP